MSLFAIAPMIPSAFSEMVSHETGLENLLELYQPSDIIKDPSLLLSFRRFFQRGTRVECCELLPEGFEPSSGFACARDPLAPRQASIRGATPQSHSPPHACLSQEITEPSSVADTHSTNISKVQRFPDSLKRYFETLHIPAKRRNRLYRVAQRIAKSETCGEYHEIEPIEPSVQRDPFATAKEVYQVLVGSSKTAVTLWNRVYYVYFADAVDRYGMSLSNSSVGRGMKSLALDKLAKDLKVTRPNVVGMYTVGCKYLTCMEAGGPGSLLSIDGAKSDIEKCNDEDFEILFNYRKNVHPDLEERSRCLDFEIVQKLVCGLRTQGVDNADIATGSTRLIRMICKYVDAGEILSHGKIVSIKRRGERECHDTSHISSGRSSPSQSPQVEEHTSSNGEKDVSSSPGSGEQRIDLRQLPLPTKDSMSVDQTYGNSSVITNGVNVGEQQLSLPQLLSTASKSNLDPRGIGLPLLRNSAEAERYDAMADYSSKRRRLDGDRSDRDVDRGDITPDVVSLQQDPQERSTQLDAQDFSTDIDEWLQEFGNIDSSNGMDFVVELLQTW